MKLNNWPNCAGLKVDGLLLAQERGLLHFGRHWNQDAWFIADETRFATSARRIDGKLWHNGSKAVMLKGTQACWPIGIEEGIYTYPNIALVEGGPDLLAAHHLFLFEECDKRMGSGRNAKRIHVYSRRCTSFIQRQAS